MHFGIERLPARAGEAPIRLDEKSTFVVPR
jgi:hypothetical protein